MKKDGVGASVKSFVKGSGLPFLSTDSNIEIVGDSRVIIEQTRAILEYNDDCVRISLGSKIAVIYGHGLSLNSYTDNIMVIDGRINKVCLE